MSFKVLMLPGDRSGCGYYRMTEPARYLTESGGDVEIQVTYELQIQGSKQNGVTKVYSVDPEGADLVVFQRPSNPAFLDSIRLLKKKGVAVVVEIDDLMHGVSTTHAGYHELVQRGAGARILACAREADAVTVSTPALARAYGTHSPAYVVPNAMPRRVAELQPAYEHSRDYLTVGWTGSVHTHPHDLEQLGTGLRTGLERVSPRAVFSIIGQAEGAKEKLSIPFNPVTVPWVGSVDEYLNAIGERFDVGIAPLRDDLFNKSKSFLKPLEYASRGVFPIYSPVVEYQRLSLGWKAKNPKDWARGIERAVCDDGFRQEVAAQARETVLERHLIEHTAERWVAAWRSALDRAAMQRGRVTC